MKSKLLKAVLLGFLCAIMMLGCGKEKLENVPDNPSQHEPQSSETYEENGSGDEEESESAEEFSYEEPEEAEVEDESSTVQESVAEEETESKESGNEEVVIINPVLENLPTEDEIEIARIRADLEALFAGIVEPITSADRSLEPEEEFANTIRYKTEITINSLTTESCNLTIEYSYVVEALIEAESNLPEDATDGQIRTMFKNLSANLRNNHYPVLEVTMDLEVVEVDGFWSLNWTKEFYDAVTGGLYSIQ